MNEAKTSRRSRWQFGTRTLFLLVLVVAVVANWMRPLALDRSYFPMAVGDEWIYESNEGDVSFLVTKTQPVDGVECFVVWRSIGKHETEFYCSVAADGVRIHQVDGATYDPPNRQLAFPSMSGSRWEWQGKIATARRSYSCTNHSLEPITVPLGKYQAFRVHQSGGVWGPGPTYPVSETDFWLVKGIGVVRLSGKNKDEHDPAGESQYFEWRLKEFRRR